MFNCLVVWGGSVSCTWPVLLSASCEDYFCPETVSVCRPGWLQSQIHLPLSPEFGIKGVHHQAQPFALFLSLGTLPLLPFPTCSEALRSSLPTWPVRLVFIFISSAVFLVGLGPSPDGIPWLASRLRMCQQRDNCTVLDHRCCASWPELEASGWPKAASSGDITLQGVKQRALGQAQTAQRWRFRQGLRFFRHLPGLDLIPYNATHTPLCGRRMRILNHSILPRTHLL